MWNSLALTEASRSRSPNIEPARATKGHLALKRDAGKALLTLQLKYQRQAVGV